MPTVELNNRPPTMESTKIQTSPKKRSLFSKQVLAKVSVAKDPVDFFSRAKEVYPKLLQEEEKKRQNRIKEAESKRLCKGIELTEIDSHDGKRRRLDVPESIAIEESLHNSQREDSEMNQRESTQSTPPNRKIRSPSIHDSHSLSKESLKGIHNPFQKNEHINDQAKLSDRNVSIQPILLDEDSDDEEKTFPLPLQSSIVEHMSETSDEEFPELIQQARERERQKALRLNAMKSSGEHASKAPNCILDDVFDTKSQPEVELDPTVELLITCEIEGTKPLRVKRKLSQRLKEARLTWCDKQPIKTDSAGRTLQDVIFFTWRRKRLFDATTCGSLGLKINNDGNFPHFQDDAESGNIHLEAWTEEALKVSELKAAAKDKKEDEQNEEITQNNSSSTSKFKVIMKARDMESCKLVVKPTTTIAKMADVFRKAKAIPDSTEISLHFDGEILDPNSTVQETELGDMENIDTVEVYLKSK